MFIIIEGLDKVGKGTISNDILKSLNYRPIIIDRGPVGYLLFDKVFHRNLDIDRDKDINFVNESGEFKVIYLYCDKKTFYDRINKYNEKILYDYPAMEEEYRKMVIESYKDPILLNTSNHTPEETVKEAIEKLSI